jgi:hypothetical protein
MRASAAFGAILAPPLRRLDGHLNDSVPIDTGNRGLAGQRFRFLLFAQINLLADVAYWPLADIASPIADVRSWG